MSSLGSQSHVESVEAAKNEDNTLYRAMPDQWPKPHAGAADGLQRGRHSREDSNNALKSEGDGNQDRNTAEGTPLFTITEQNSIATLKTIPTNLTFQQRILTSQPPNTIAEQGPEGHGNASKQSRYCFSLDENALYKSGRAKGEGSQATSAG